MIRFILVTFLLLTTPARAGIISQCIYLAQCMGADCKAIIHEVETRSGRKVLKRPIVRRGNRILEMRAEPVPHAVIPTDSIQHLLDDMTHTMLEGGGIGLAAPQVGMSLRVLVMLHKGKVLTIVNPKLTVLDARLETNAEECMSILNFSRVVSRPRKVRVEYLDRDGKQQTADFSGFSAAIVQHEIDHLDGILISMER